MLRIQQITSDAQQQQTIILPDGTAIGLTLRYSLQQFGWFADINYGSNFLLQGIRICVSPNILRQWKNVIPFGIGCAITTNNREPTQIADFSSGLFQLLILESSDVQGYENYLKTGVA